MSRIYSPCNGIKSLPRAHKRGVKEGGRKIRNILSKAKWKRKRSRKFDENPATINAHNGLHWILNICCVVLLSLFPFVRLHFFIYTFISNMDACVRLSLSFDVVSSFFFLSFYLWLSNVSIQQFKSYFQCLIRFEREERKAKEMEYIFPYRNAKIDRWCKRHKRKALDVIYHHQMHTMDEKTTENPTSFFSSLHT